MYIYFRQNQSGGGGGGRIPTKCVYGVPTKASDELKIRAKMIVEKVEMRF